ncbi:hypothetical protein G1K46_05065 [Tenacibaculum finnmarkense]|uniref:hypothetical protein n=1 Tax=Tenacibaculum finnmarkense TaxID=2781243 RepID=UPI001EFB04FB|nr:hypothetical protein [Tenacibaculum finnmarkense]MCG8762109.1 hypothetical protein [Tenacibaculum finnmarkense]MCG8787485.1 hypothetical protein [Tenacibaculum finnmarkense]
MKIGAKVLVQGEVISLEKVEEDTYAEVFFYDGSTAYVDVKDFKQSENKPNIALNINSLISELKIEVHQCNCCTSLNQHPEWSRKLANVVQESILKAVLNAQDTFLKTSDVNSQHNK